VEPFFSGMITMGFLIGGLFFARFWTRTRDALFLAFSFAFCLLALNQLLLTLGNVPAEERSWLYLLRLAAFICIAIAVMRKNTGRGVRR
jgi:uncharacterized membrane protein YbhN (UPF0104 family)